MYSLFFEETPIILFILRPPCSYLSLVIMLIDIDQNCHVRNDESYGVDASWSSAADSLCNMDPGKIILENVGRNFHGNYSCQVGNITPIVNINLSLLIIFLCQYKI